MSKKKIEYPAWVEKLRKEGHAVKDLRTISKIALQLPERELKYSKYPEIRAMYRAMTRDLFGFLDFVFPKKKKND